MKNELEMLVERLKVRPSPPRRPLGHAHLPSWTIAPRTASRISSDRICWLITLAGLLGAYDVTVHACARVSADADPDVDELNDLGPQAAQVPPPILRRPRGGTSNMARQPQVRKGQPTPAVQQRRARHLVTHLPARELTNGRRCWLTLRDPRRCWRRSCLFSR